MNVLLLIDAKHTLLLPALTSFAAEVLFPQDVPKIIFIDADQAQSSLLGAAVSK